MQPELTPQKQEPIPTTTVPVTPSSTIPGKSTPSSTIPPVTTPTTLPYVPTTVSPTQTTTPATTGTTLPPLVIVGSGTGQKGDWDPAYQMPWNNPATAAKFDSTVIKTDAAYQYTGKDINIWLRQTPADAKRWQSLMVQAFPGKLTLSQAQYGNVADKETQSFFKNTLLLYINTSPDLRGMKIEDALTYLAANPVQLGGAGGGRKVSLTNKADLEESLNQTAESVLGRRLGPQEAPLLKAFVNQFHKAETTYQTGGSGREQAPAASVAAKQMLTEKLPTEAKANDYSSYIGALSKLLGA